MRLAAAAKDRGEGFRFISPSHGHEKAKCKPRKYQVILFEMSSHSYIGPGKILSELLVNCGQFQFK